MSARFMSRCDFEALGDAAAEAGRMADACRAYIYGHVNGKLSFLLGAEQGASQGADLCFDAVVAGNFAALKTMVLGGRPLSARTLAVLFDTRDRQMLDLVFVPELLEAGGVAGDVDLVASVQVEKHVARARAGRVHLNGALAAWGPAESRELVRVAQMPPERARESRTRLPRRVLAEAMLFAALAGAGQRLTVHEVARAAREASPAVVAELLTYFPGVSLTRADAAAILGRPGFAGLVDRVLAATDDTLVSYVSKDYGPRVAALFLTRS